MDKGSILLISNFMTSNTHYKNLWHFFAQRLSQRGWRVLTTSSKENQFLRLIDMLWTIWKERDNFLLAQIDVFSGKAFIFAEACTFLLKQLNKPIILILHGGRLPEFSKRYPNRIRNVLGPAEIVVTPSPYIKSALLPFCSNIQLIPNPIELPSSIFRLREKVKPNLIWVRAFHYVYNPSLVPKVVKILNKQYPSLKIIMLGPDKKDGSLDAMLTKAKELGVEDKIKVEGIVNHDDIPKWLDKADIFINTTNYDTSPRSLIEAMANGLCVVSTDVGGVPFIIDDGESGLLVPPDDAIAMANAIDKLLLDPGLARKLSHNARLKVQENDWSTILPIWDRLFCKIINSEK